MTSIKMSKRVWSVVRKCKLPSIFLKNVLELVFPKKCIGCGLFGEYLCFACASEIELIKTSLCPGCGKLTDMSRFCNKCRRKHGLSLKGIIIATHYKSPHIKEMIYDLKYNGITAYSEIFGELLYQSAKLINFGANPVITAVPLFPKKEKHRGFNQSKFIAEKVSKRLAIPYHDLLKRRVNSKPQSGLRREERIQNVQNIFALSGDETLVLGKTIILVDDITTTHATLNECAKVLRENGAKEVIGLVVARNI